MYEKECFEMVTVGCVGKYRLCDPNMHIWSIPQVNQSANNVVYLIFGVSITVNSLRVFLVGARETKKRFKKHLKEFN